MKLPPVLTSADMRALRVHNGVAERLVGTGQWQRAARGLYLLHAEEPSRYELIAAARACAGREAAITGLVALAELRLPWLPPTGHVHVLVPPTTRRAGGDRVRITRASDFDRLETWSRYGMRFADPARAAVDAGRSLPSLREVRGVILGAASSRWTTAAEMLAVLDAGQRNGSALARRAIADAARGCASPPEAELVDGLVGRGTPFYVNPQLWVGDVLLGHPDVWLVGRGVGGEVESHERHGSEQQGENTYDRHERFRAVGLDLAHLSVRRIRADVDEAARYLLARPAVTEPPGLRVVPRGPLLR